ncbi:MAG: hypothetical protein H3C62_13035 [Gemmatimonadaceae bacterium]|nr:hypothetical protein [Gemmatimonadaceae bacterium]
MVAVRYRSLAQLALLSPAELTQLDAELRLTAAAEPDAHAADLAQLARAIAYRSRCEAGLVPSLAR